MRQVRDQIVLAMRLVTQSLLHLALTVTHAVKGALDLKKSPSMLSQVSG